MQALVLAFAAIFAALVSLPRVDDPRVPQRVRSSASTPAEAGGIPTQPDILLVLTDDQRPDSIPGEAPLSIPQDIFPNVEALLMNQGITFRRAYNTNPLCAPARAAFLSGGFRGQNNGVLFNTLPLGGAPGLDDRISIGTLMQAKGYRTAFIGKYPNNYQNLTGIDTQGNPIGPLHYVPPGWDVFVHRQFSQNMFINNFVFGASTSAGPEYGLKIPGDQALIPSFVTTLEAQGFPTTVGDYLRNYDIQNQPYNVTFVESLGLALLEDAKTSPEPWFIFLAVEPPHEPATPDLPDQGVYAGYTYQEAAWGEPDLSDKPRHTQVHAMEFDDIYSPPNDPDGLWQLMLESMRSVDRMMGALVNEIDSHPALDGQTAVFFTSDNGFLWGEHQLTEKRAAYEESVRAPFIARVPGTPANVTRDGLVAVNLDIPATIFELAGYTPTEIATTIGSDGTSLIPLMQDPAASWRSHLTLQSFGNEVINGFAFDTSWVCVPQPPLKYVEHDYFAADGAITRELYDLVLDPFEESSQHGDPAQAATMAALSQLGAQDAGLYLTEFSTWENEIPPARVNRSYSHALVPRGGTPPYSFSLSSTVPGSTADCTLTPPPGVSLSPSGVLSGIPTQRGCYEFVVAVQDSSISPQNGLPQRFASRVRLRVSLPTDIASGDPGQQGGFQLIDAQSSTVVVTPGGPTIANGADTAVITVTLKSPAGTPVQGQDVSLLVSGNANTVLQPMGPTNANGVVAGTVASTVAETKTVTVVVDSTGTILGVKPKLDFTGDPASIDALNSSASAFPATVQADGLTTSTISLTVRDALSNPVAGQIVTLSASGSGNTITQRMLTDANGQAQGALASSIVGAKTVTVTINPGPGQVVLSDMPVVTFVP